jgi:hypothetical protein
VGEHHGLDERLDQLSLLGTESSQGLEVEAQIVAGIALIRIEDERVSAGRQGEGDPLESIEGGLRRPGLIPAELNNMNARKVRQFLLGEPALFSKGDKAFGKRHLAQNGTEGVLMRSCSHRRYVSIARAY